MRYLKLTVAYDGTDYVGWQIQPNGISIQECLEAAWLGCTGEKIRIIASGRTDSGVHARAQVCSLATSTPLECHTICRALNALTPIDISVLAVDNAPTGFHAIRDALRKTYRYQIQFGRIRDPIGRRFRWFLPHQLDVAAIKSAASHLIGERDFASFQAAGSERASTVRHLSQLDCHEYQRGHFHRLDLELSCNGFLYNMVRNIVGTLVQVGQGRLAADRIPWVLQQKNRSEAGPTAPAHGLLLIRVEYDGADEPNGTADSGLGN